MLNIELRGYSTAKYSIGMINFAQNVGASSEGVSNGLDMDMSMLNFGIITMLNMLLQLIFVQPTLF